MFRPLTEVATITFPLHRRCWNVERAMVLLSGGSNAILTYLNWVNAICWHAPPVEDGLRTYYVDVVDVVFDVKLRKVVHLRTKFSRMTGGPGGFKDKSPKMRAKLVGVWKGALLHRRGRGGVRHGAGQAFIGDGTTLAEHRRGLQGYGGGLGAVARAERALFAQMMIYWCAEYGTSISVRTIPTTASVTTSRWRSTLAT